MVFEVRANCICTVIDKANIHTKKLTHTLTLRLTLTFALAFQHISIASGTPNSIYLTRKEKILMQRE